MSTTIPSTNEKISRQNTFCCCSRHCAAICASLYGIISTLLLPFTIRGRIGGQYGVLITKDDKEGRPELMNLTDMSFAVEMFLIGLVFFAHLLGFISVLKKWAGGLVFYFYFRFCEITICFIWLIDVLSEDIKSHLMSQYSLGWYCFFALIIEFISFFAVSTLCYERTIKDEADEELPSSMFV